MTARRSFRPLMLVGLVLLASLSCYLISLRVASERAALEKVERDIAMVTRDIRELETEIGTRGRLAQLERWNARFLRLSAPKAEQFVDTGFHLADMTRPETRDAIEAPVVLASASVEPAISIEMDEPATATQPVAPPAAKEPAARDLMQLASADRISPQKPSRRDAQPSKKAAPQPRDPLAPLEAPAD